MKKKVKRLGAVALAVVILAVLTGCGTQKVSASASKNQEVMWLLYLVRMLIRRV